MRCSICDFDPVLDQRANNYLTTDKTTGKPICAVCQEIIIDAIMEFGTEECSDEYKKEHGIT